MLVSIVVEIANPEYIDLEMLSGLLCPDDEKIQGAVMMQGLRSAAQAGPDTILVQQDIQEGSIGIDYKETWCPINADTRVWWYDNGLDRLRLERTIDEKWKITEARVHSRQLKTALQYAGMPITITL